MIEHKLIRCDADDPLRCQAGGASGQCPYRAIENSNYCARHDGQGESLRKKARMSMYRLNQYQQRVTEMADSDQVKSLREEIGILRMVLEKIINSCKTDTELIIYSGRISDTVIKIEKLVATCQRLEVATGEMMDKTKALQLAQVIIGIITKHIPNPDAVSIASDEIITAVLGTSPILDDE